MSVGQEIWVVATGCKDDGAKEDLYKQIAPKGEGAYKFPVPEGLLFGSFDSLVRLTDELQKYDSQVDSIVHRFERQYIEIDPRADFKVKAQRQEKDLMEYLKTWQWDEAKYPKSRTIGDNLTLLMSVVNKLDEEARNKTAQYNEYKSQNSNLSKKDATNLLGRDLVDVLTPETVVVKGGHHDDDFIYTEHLTTVTVICPRGTEGDFLKCYASLVPTVVPGSAKNFKALADKDGNTLWRVVLFKSDADNFKRACRERRLVPRDFEYSEEGFKKLTEQRAQTEDQVKRQHQLVQSLYKAAWSDAMVAWVHIKAMRIFVESVLRYGMPPKFAPFLVTPKASAAPAVRKLLANILGKGPAGASEGAGGQEDKDDEEYFPYVSLAFTPFTMARG